MIDLVLQARQMSRLCAHVVGMSSSVGKSVGTLDSKQMLQVRLLLRAVKLNGRAILAILLILW